MVGLNRRWMLNLIVICLLVLSMMYGFSQFTNSHFSISLKSGGQRSKANILDPNGPPSEYIKKNIENIKLVCGEVCETNYPLPKYNPTQDFYAPIRKYFDCPSLLSERSHDLPSPPSLKKPFETIPDFLQDDFLYNGRVKLGRWFLPKSYVAIKPDDPNQGTHLNITKEEVNAKVAAYHKKDWEEVGGYGPGPTKTCSEMIEKYMHLNGTRVLVVGTESPWLESIAFAQGAREVVTLEYRKIVSTVPKHSAYQPGKFFDLAAEGKIEPFDRVLHFSSLEHSGLGRYGDGMHPWGDLVTQARLWCITKDDGMLFASVPYGNNPPHDEIMYNAHKCYGPVMGAHLFANWKMVDVFEYGQPTRDPCPGHKHHVAAKLPNKRRFLWFWDW